ncbi:hypothetical protein OsccyDRAFT_4149 [Leptolyngbyaceae cyanobacterium JSC-12]|nr:hypothetical protein OsccyDRAFT_4149 [Leptolyngbyaceae cyanobacterium JSC-12]
MTVLSSHDLNQSGWKTILVLVLAFWLSSSLLLDGLVMPSMYVSGMMTEPGFATAGYSLFWLFNRVELLCAALIFTSVLVLRYSRHPWNRPGYFTVLASALLMVIALVDTYGLTPQMSALGLQLNWFTPSEPSTLMNQLHIEYWLLDCLKILIGGALLWRYNRVPTSVSQM